MEDRLSSVARLIAPCDPSSRPHPQRYERMREVDEAIALQRRDTDAGNDMVQIR